MVVAMVAMVVVALVDMTNIVGEESCAQGAQGKTHYC